MRIRKATAHDASAIARVHHDSWQTAYRGLLPEEFMASLTCEKREKAWEGVLNDPETRCLCVASDPSDRVVGFAYARCENDDPTFRGRLIAIYVLPSHQGQGIGRRLVSWIAQHLSQEGASSLLVGTPVDNRPARRFYEALGGQWLRESESDWGGVRVSIAFYGWADTQILWSDTAITA